MLRFSIKKVYQLNPSQDGVCLDIESKEGSKCSVILGWSEWGSRRWASGSSENLMTIERHLLVFREKDIEDINKFHIPAVRCS